MVVRRARRHGLIDAAPVAAVDATGLETRRVWFAGVGLTSPAVRCFVFDSSLAMAEAASQGAGVALLPARMFEGAQREGRLVRPFHVEVTLGGYWLTRLKSRDETAAIIAFRSWIIDACATEPDAQIKRAGNP